MSRENDALKELLRLTRDLPEWAFDDTVPAPKQTPACCCFISSIYVDTWCISPVCSVHPRRAHRYVSIAAYDEVKRLLRG